MNWLRSRPKLAIAAGVAAVLLVLIVVVLLVKPAHQPASDPSALGTDLPQDTPTSPAILPVNPSSSPLPSKSLANNLNLGSGFNLAGAGLIGSGKSLHLTPHRLVMTAGSDGPLLGVGWISPTADGPRKGKDTSYKSTFRLAQTVYGKPKYAVLYTFDGPNSTRVWCTFTVDGKVVEHQEARGPWGQVYCQG